MVRTALMELLRLLLHAGQVREADSGAELEGDSKEDVLKWIETRVLRDNE
jgi:hypothetical protein